MLSIKDFSEMACLSAQTLRYYHAEGLLVPAHVDERTGYRSYTFDQVGDAMLISVLREAGLGVKQVRQALDEPDLALDLLREHIADVQRRRADQDEAIQTARDLLESPPEPGSRRVPAMTVVSRLAPVTPPGGDREEWDLGETILEAAADDLLATVRSAGGVPVGTPWRTMAPGSGSAAEGPFWLVQVAVQDGSVTPADLPPGAEMHEYDAVEELFITMPGRSSVAKYSTAVGRLMAHPLDDAFPDLGRLRHSVGAGGVEFSMPIQGVCGSGSSCGSACCSPSDPGGIDT